jgi:hypothetical protein
LERVQGVAGYLVPKDCPDAALNAVEERHADMMVEFLLIGNNISR